MLRSPGCTGGCRDERAGSPDAGSRGADRCDGLPDAGMDGPATVEIRKLPPPEALVPIVALTANAFRSDQERCLAVGMNDS